MPADSCGCSLATRERLLRAGERSQAHSSRSRGPQRGTHNFDHHRHEGRSEVHQGHVRRASLTSHPCSRRAETDLDFEPSLFPPQAKPAAKASTNTKAHTAKPNDIIRFSNMRDFEIGRIPRDVCKWLAPLLDQKLVHVEGKVVFCKVPLEKIGDEITLSLSVWLRPEVFVQVRRPMPTEQEEKKPSWGSLVNETPDEERLSKRKGGLNTLFSAFCSDSSSSSDEVGRLIDLFPLLTDALNVKPTVASAISTDSKVPSSPETAAKGKSQKGKEREVGVVEEISDNGGEEEEGTAIEKKDIDLIYAKYVLAALVRFRLRGKPADQISSHFAGPRRTIASCPRWSRRRPSLSLCVHTRSKPSGGCQAMRPAPTRDETPTYIPSGSSAFLPPLPLSRLD